MEVDGLGTGGPVPEVPAHGRTDVFAQFVERIGVGEEIHPEGAGNIAAIRALFNEKDELRHGVGEPSFVSDLF